MENKIRNLLFGMERRKTNYCNWSNMRRNCLVDDIVLTTGDTREASCKTVIADAIFCAIRPPKKYSILFHSSLFVNTHAQSQ